MRVGKAVLGWLLAARTLARERAACIERVVAGVGEQRAQLAAVLLALALPLLDAVRLRVALARPAPQTLSCRCVGPSLNEACMASPSMVVPNTDFQK